MAFVPQTFLSQEVGEITQQFLTLRKSDVLALGKHLELDVKAAMRKSQIQEIVLEHLVDDDVIPKGLIEVPKVSESGSAVEVRKLELQHELELKKLAEKEEKARLEEKTRTGKDEIRGE
jgi:hypothetical protein